jgi:uncharacterized protein (DUF1330 family)
MAKGYWITFYREVKRLDAFTAVPIIEGAGGKFLVRGMPARVYEKGLTERVVLIEFETVDKAIATFESEAYQETAKLLVGVVERDIRIVEET